MVNAKGEEATTSAYLNGERALNKAMQAAKRGAGVNDPLEARLNATSPGFADNIWSNWALGVEIEFGSGGPLDQLSAKYLFDEDEFAGADVILPNGYDTSGLNV